MAHAALAAAGLPEGQGEVHERSDGRDQQDGGDAGGGEGGARQSNHDGDDGGVASQRGSAGRRICEVGPQAVSPRTVARAEGERGGGRGDDGLLDGASGGDAQDAGTRHGGRRGGVSDGHVQEPQVAGRQAVAS